MPKVSSDYVPKYRYHRPSGQARVTIEGRDFWLGPHKSKASLVEYDRISNEWLANGRQLYNRRTAAIPKRLPGFPGGRVCTYQIA